MVWQLAEKIPRFKNLEAASVRSFESLPWTASLVLASCLPVKVPENIYFKICRSAKSPGFIHVKRHHYFCLLCIFCIQG